MACSSASKLQLVIKRKAKSERSAELFQFDIIVCPLLTRNITLYYTKIIIYIKTTPLLLVSTDVYILLAICSFKMYG